MFDIIRRLTAYNIKVRGKSVKEALWYTIRRINAWPCNPSTCCRPPM